MTDPTIHDLLAADPDYAAWIAEAAMTDEALDQMAADYEEG